MNKRTTFFAWFAALPAIIVALGCVWSLSAAALRPDGGLWPPDGVTLAEAAAINNSGEVARLVSTGADPNRRTTVRGGILTDASLKLTPIEAAVWARNEPVARQLVELGVVMDKSTVRRLRCLHDAHADAAVQLWLASVSKTPWPTCTAEDLKVTR